MRLVVRVRRRLARLLERLADDLAPPAVECSSLDIDAFDEVTAFEGQYGSPGPVFVRATNLAEVTAGTLTCAAVWAAGGGLGHYGHVGLRHPLYRVRIEFTVRLRRATETEAEGEVTAHGPAVVGWLRRLAGGGPLGVVDEVRRENG